MMPAGHVPIPPRADEDGYDLWMRYQPIADVSLRDRYRRDIASVCVIGSLATLLAAGDELERGLSGLLGRSLARSSSVTADGAVVIGTNSALRAVGRAAPSKTIAEEGFAIRSEKIGDKRAIVISSPSDTGVLYGTFHLLRLLQTGQRVDALDVAEQPRLNLRILDHWDNLDGSIERGYAGRSLWKWSELPHTLDPRYVDYARACASIGINGSVLNNVNADARSLSDEYLGKAAALANVFRAYGIRVYLSANFAAPITLGALATADPLDANVRLWWRKRADAIYRLIPDFGGFVVKANSENQPGPQDYDRTHADGANCLADALAPHGGIVMWRAFVYNESVDPDRAKRAYIEFTALDGQFRDNVIIQVKNGPIDFQPREPFHPLFGAMKRTPVMAEVQIAQEYLGFSNHLVYLGTMWKEFLESDTFAAGAGSTVSKTIDGSIYPTKLTGLCAVSNTGDDRNWCGHHFLQANWYAFGRLAWDHELPVEHIADEWIRMTWTNDAETVEMIRRLMMQSREALVDYSMPLGLHHLIGGDHYSPKPWNDTEPRDDWTAVYYHQADKDVIGFDRTMRGNRATGQYFAAARDRFDSLETCPENLLLWFHRVPWDFRMFSGRTLWEEIQSHYRDGARRAGAMRDRWLTLAENVDVARHRAVAAKMDIQSRDAAEWAEQCIAFFDRVRREGTSRSASQEDRPRRAAR